MNTFNTSRCIVFILFFLVGVHCNADTHNSAINIVTVNGIDVPIMGKEAVNCSKVVSNKINIIYIDDTSPVYQNSNDLGDDNYDQKKHGDDDPNAVQDLVLILALAKKHSTKINLIGIGSSNEDVNGNNHALLQRAVNKLVPNLGVAIWKETELAEKIRQYASCPNAKSGSWLRVAMGGEWIKLKKALDSDTRDPSDPNHIRYRIFATLLGGHNIASNSRYYDGNPATAKSPVEADLRECVRYWKSGNTADSFRNVFNPDRGETAMTSTELDDWYATHLKPHLRRVVDPLGNRLDSGNSYEYKVLRTGYNPWGSRLRIADFLSVAEWIWPRESVNKKSFILPKLEAALAEL